MVIAIPKIRKHWASCLIADSPAQAKRILTMTGKNFDDYVFYNIRLNKKKDTQ